MVRFWEELRENAKRDTPHMPEADWDKFELEMVAQEAAEQKQLEAEENERMNTVPAGSTAPPLTLAPA